MAERSLPAARKARLEEGELELAPRPSLVTIAIDHRHLALRAGAIDRRPVAAESAAVLVAGSEAADPQPQRPSSLRVIDCHLEDGKALEFGGPDRIDRAIPPH